MGRLLKVKLLANYFHKPLLGGHTYKEYLDWTYHLCSPGQPRANWIRLYYDYRIHPESSFLFTDVVSVSITN